MEKMTQSELLKRVKAYQNSPYRKEYDKELDKDEKSIAKKFLKFQEKTINHLKEYI